MEPNKPVKLRSQHLVLGGALLLLAAFAVAGLAAVPHSHPPVTTQRTAAVTIQDNAFTPSNMTVKKGTRVTWHISANDEDTYVVMPNPAPDTAAPGLGSGQIHGTQTYSYVFDQPGTYGYHNQ